MKKIELHRHLDVAVRTSTLLELLQERGLEASSTLLKEFQDRFYLRTPLTDLNAVLATFSLFQDVLDQFDVYERVALEAIEDCVQEGLCFSVLTISPGSLFRDLECCPLSIESQSGPFRPMSTPFILA